MLLPEILHFDKFGGADFKYVNSFLSVNLKNRVLVPNWKFLTFCIKLSTLRALIANIAISFSICSLSFSIKFFTQHKTFIFKQFEGTDFKFDTHSYSNRNIQSRCIGPNDKVTLFRWRHYIFINLKLLTSNLSITFWNSYSVTPTLSTFYPQVYILLDSGMIISGLTKNYNFKRNLL